MMEKLATGGASGSSELVGNFGSVLFDALNPLYFLVLDVYA